MRIYMLLLLFALITSMSPGEYAVSGRVLDVRDSRPLNGNIRFVIGADTTLLPVVNGSYGGTVTNIAGGPAPVPRNYELSVYPTVLPPGQNTVTARLVTPAPANREAIKTEVFNMLGQKVDISRAMAFQPLIIRFRLPGKTVNRRIFAAAPFALRMMVEAAPSVSVSGAGLLKPAAGDSAAACVTVTVDGYRTLVDTLMLSVSGVNTNDFDLSPLIRSVVVNYRDAGSKVPVVGDSLLVSDAVSGEVYSRSVTDSGGNVVFDVPNDDISLSLKFSSPDSSYLFFTDTVGVAGVDTVFSEGIQNFPVNEDYWNGFKDYMFYITGAKWGDPVGGKFARFGKSPIPVYIDEKVEGDVDWKQLFIDSLIVPHNDAVRSSENPGDYLFMTDDRDLADREGILVIYDNNNYTEDHGANYIISDAEVYWNTRKGVNNEYVQLSLAEVNHEVLLHAVKAGVHSPDIKDNYSGDVEVMPRPHEDYLSKVLRNKTVQNLKGYEDID